MALRVSISQVSIPTVIISQLQGSQASTREPNNPNGTTRNYFATVPGPIIVPKRPAWLMMICSFFFFHILLLCFIVALVG